MLLHVNRKANDVSSDQCAYKGTPGVQLAWREFSHPLLHRPCQQGHSWCQEAPPQLVQTYAGLSPMHMLFHRHPETFAGPVEVFQPCLPLQFLLQWLRSQLETPPTPDPILCLPHESIADPELLAQLHTSMQAQVVN